MANTSWIKSESFTGYVIDGYTGNKFPLTSSGLVAVVDIYKPDLRRRKPTGYLYPTPYSFFKRVAIGEPCEWSYTRYGSEHYKWYGRPSAFSDTTLYGIYLPAGQAQKDKAVTNALLKLKNQKFNAGVAIGEARATAGLLGTTATRVAKSILLFRKGRVREAFAAIGQSPPDPNRFIRLTRRREEYLREKGLLTRKRRLLKPTNNWLELQYGWLPLLSEIKGAVDLVQQPPEVSNEVVTVKGVYRDSNEFNFEKNPHPTGTAVWKGKADVGVFVRLDYIPDDHYKALASSLGLTNPLEIVWELTPYSFVLDWMLPIGDWLSTLDAALGYKFLSGSVSVRQRVKGEITMRAYDSYPFSNCRHGGRSRLDVVRLDREVYTSSPLPHLPRFKNPLSLGHMANGLSLLAQVLGRR